MLLNMSLQPYLAKDAESWVTWTPVPNPGPDNSPTACKGKDNFPAMWLFKKTWKKHSLQSSQKGGEDNIGNCFPGTGDRKQHSCSFWKCQRARKKVPRELSSSESTIGGSRIMLHMIISFFWKHCSGSPGLTNFPNNKYYLKKQTCKL